MGFFKACVCVHLCVYCCKLARIYIYHKCTWKYGLNSPHTLWFTHAKQVRAHTLQSRVGDLFTVIPVHAQQHRELCCQPYTKSFNLFVQRDCYLFWQAMGQNEINPILTTETPPVNASIVLIFIFLKQGWVSPGGTKGRCKGWLGNLPWSRGSKLTPYLTVLLV